MAQKAAGGAKAPRAYGPGAVLRPVWRGALVLVVLDGVLRLALG